MFNSLLIICLALFSLQVNAGNVPQAGSVANIGQAKNSTTQPAISIPLGSLGNSIVLQAGDISCTSTNYYGFQKLGDTVQGVAQVPAAKTWHCLAIEVGENVTGNLSVMFGSATSTFTDESAGAPTGAIYNNPSKITGEDAMAFASSTDRGTPDVRATHLIFSASTFPFIRVVCGSAADWYMRLECVQL